MIQPDVNILIGALRDDAPHHDAVSRWLAGTLSGGEELGLTPAVVGGYLRIVTHPRIYAKPTPLDVAIGHIETLRDNEMVVDARPGPRHWEILARLCRAADARGALVSDAAHAATAIEHGATWITFDRDFARFPRLKWRHPDLSE